jgi:hypothetical protein
MKWKKRELIMLQSLLVLIGVILVGLPSQAIEVTQEFEQDSRDGFLSKINFDMTRISAEGLIGDSDSLRSVSYEFCIPTNSEALKEVKAISPELSYYANSPGRIGCNEEQYLCLGDTYNPRWKEILLSLASLEYVTRIEQFWGE